MPSITRCYALGAAIGLGLPGAAAWAEDATTPQIAIGAAVGLAPDYLGSDDTEIAPIFSVSVTTDRFTFRNNGQGIEVDIARAFTGEPGITAYGPILGGRGVIGFGPILRYDGGRNDSGKVEDRVVALMAPVKASFEAGAFVDTTVPIQSNGGGEPTLVLARLSVVQGLDGGHEGILAEAALGVLKPLGKWTIGGGVTLAAGDGDYTNAFFGVSAADAAVTGLSPYAAGGGLRDAGVAVFTSYAVNDRLSVDLTTSYNKLLGDAADSPVVVERGTADQVFAAIGLTWQF